MIVQAMPPAPSPHKFIHTENTKTNNIHKTSKQTGKRVEMRTSMHPSKAMQHHTKHSRACWTAPTQTNIHNITQYAPAWTGHPKTHGCKISKQTNKQANTVAFRKICCLLACLCCCKEAQAQPRHRPKPSQDPGPGPGAARPRHRRHMPRLRAMWREPESAHWSSGAHDKSADGTPHYQQYIREST